MKVLRLFSILIVLSVLMFAACSSSDTTKVTIYFSNDKQATLEQNKLPLIDKILNFFTTKVYAQHLPEHTEYIELFVFADDFDGTYAIVPGTASSISIEVPSGNDRIFLLYSISPNSEINYAGQHVADLTGGDTSFSVNMYPCLIDIVADSQTTNSFIDLTWTFDSTLYPAFSTVDIYRACIGTSCDGTFSPLPSNSLNETTSDSDGLIVDNVYYYFVRINTGSFGGGGMPVPSSLEDYYTNYAYFIFFNTLASVQFIGIQ